MPSLARVPGADQFAEAQHYAPLPLLHDPDGWAKNHPQQQQNQTDPGKQAKNCSHCLFSVFPASEKDDDVLDLLGCQPTSEARHGRFHAIGGSLA